MSENILKDPDFLFTLLAAIMKRQDGTLVITEEDILSVDMTEAVALNYDRTNGHIVLRFITEEEILKRSLAVDHLKKKISTPRLKLVPEFEDEDDD